MEYFVVRIYRNEDDSQQSYGVVERVGDDRKESFTNSEELWSILHAESGRDASRGGKRQKNAAQAKDGRRVVDYKSGRRIYG
jgi:hypothetical protein